MTTTVDQPEQSEQPESRESMGKNESKNDKKEEQGRDIFLERWFHILATVLMSVLILTCCAVPLILCFAAFNASSPGSESQDVSQMTLFGSVVAMLGILMASIFVFMTIRIDRGAKAEARRVSERALRQVDCRTKRQVDRATEYAKEQLRIELREMFDEMMRQATEKADGNDEEGIWYRRTSRLIAMMLRRFPKEK